MSEEKTEKPTPQKRKENRKQGQVPRTQELGGWGSLLLITLVLPLLVKREFTQLKEMATQMYRWDHAPTAAEASQLLGQAATHIIWAIVIPGSAILVIGVAAALSQGGFYLATKSMKPSLKKYDPVQGMKRLFGPQAWWEGAKTLIKSVLVGTVLYFSLRAVVELPGGLVPVGTVLGVVADNSISMLRNVALMGLVIAGLDYAMTRRRLNKQTKMSKDEVKQEHKQSEGDPLLKGAIRSRQLAASRNRMMADVPQADVVLTNPTHVAVALRYDPEKGAPRVIAAGAGDVATRIREIATEARVALVQDVPLARALFRSTKVGQEIPEELFTAVATVLAFVINQKSQGVHGGRHRSPRSASEELPEVGVRRRRAPRHVAGDDAEQPGHANPGDRGTASAQTGG